jgi:hypothetical protein
MSHHLMPPYCRLLIFNLLFSAKLVKLQQVYAGMREELAAGGGVNIVCSLVDESSSYAAILPS